MSPEKTLQRLIKLSPNGELLKNRILDVLMSPSGGMNEIMAIIEISHQLNSKEFDCIVLDTPPGKHFLDFLKASSKINQFFDKTFVDIFSYFENKKQNQKRGIISLLVSSGVKKLLEYLGRVTGEGFVQDFIAAISGLYQNREYFLEGLKLEHQLKDEHFCQWFLVTSAEQSNFKEAQELNNDVQGFTKEKIHIVINRSTRQALANWNVELDSPFIELRNSMLDRQNKIKSLAQKQFQDILEFPEVIQVDPVQHVKFLSKIWKKNHD